MSTLGTRIKEVRGQETQESFAAKIGVSKGALGGYERDENSPSAEAILKICSGAEISVEWLMTGRGTMRPSENSSPIVYQNGPDDTDVVWVPMVDAVLSAGHGSFETSAHSERKYAFRLDFISRKGNPANMVLMRVAGDSMAPEILHNDVVLIEQGKKTITPGHIFAVGFEESIYLKRIDNLPGKVILKSANPAYPPVELDVRGQNEDQFRIIGRVLWSGREYF
ncbi:MULTISPECIES: XRE family transcriptional regulator [Desulfovibrio]|uniref:Phage repressor protein C, contains Cro/C1-type HTH and peptisase s24 domains n=1 Tax=Desulfovibrio desulfuricans TaxID=876 RepID=A0AA94HSF4_DESDE|nr:MULTISPECIES: helix-turn-helix transcriptional regulator [Desulfovibrio]ATD82441.1 Cro/Cl family transcriptional regulator [Desulfovibrio sp. G11]SFW42972.1 Phage repressor protein C, contains Cro/C1-type HTH and peptisase s24 domains [Desulfovibrio desulfuricans]SPD35229.1 Bacteriophage CI repressor [Desulfovibrio sp. G11]